ncbi:MAG TPA: FAD-dependent oxidoreductase [Aggregatilineales bacterium]|nr:FAD-dependent oxidoreductase [Aggregatilineales bacterium]
MSDKKRTSASLSRRNFLRGVGFAAAGAGALAGCSPQVVPSEATSEPQAPAASAQPSFLTPPDPIPDSEIKETVTADVVVVGAGVAGLSAALAAAEAGAKVAVIEKRETFTTRGMHIAAVGSKVQKELGIEFDAEQAVREIVRWSLKRVKENLHWLFIRKSGEAMDWITDMVRAEGMDVSIWAGRYKGPDYHEYPVTHIVMGPAAQRFANMEDVGFVLEKNAKERNADFYYNTRAVQLIRPNNSRVTGVIAQNADGDYVKYEATKGVILATGDYSGDDEMIDYYCPPARIADVSVYTPVGVNTGDGHKMGLWAGAAMQASEPHAPMIHMQGAANTYCFLHVNKFGQRFQNEDITTQAACTGKAIQPDNIAWSVFDENCLEMLPETVEIGGGLFWDQVSRMWGQPFDLERERASIQRHIDNGNIVTADTIEELAEKMGVPADNLKATVDRYNQLADKGKDEDFGKRPELLCRIDKPPFYAAILKSALLVIVGGLSINEDMQVLDSEGLPIPGLYAVGNVAGDFFGGDYPTIFPGHSHGRAITFGRIAGTIAAGGEA